MNSTVEDFFFTLRRPRIDSKKNRSANLNFQLGKLLFWLDCSAQQKRENLLWCMLKGFGSCILAERYIPF